MNKKNQIKYETLVLDRQYFIRPEGFYFDQKGLSDLDKKLEHLSTGDIVIMTTVEKTLENREKHLSEAKFFLVCNDSNVDEIQNEKYLCEPNKAANGWPIIPLNISRKLEQTFAGDFIQDYMKKFLKIFQEYSNCFKGIELDLESKLLPKDFMAKHKIINNNNNDVKVFYFFQNPSNPSDKEFDGDYFAWLNRPDPDIDNFYSLSNDLNNLDIDMDQSIESANASINESDINPKTNQILSFENFTNRDPELEEYATSFKSIYENQFREIYLKNLKKNDPIQVTSMPTKEYCKETFENDIMNATTLTFYFDSLELDDLGNLTAVIASSYDRKHTYFFESFICSTYGPFFSTNLLTCMYDVGRTNSKEQMFFLDLPVDLYNLLESE